MKFKTGKKDYFRIDVRKDDKNNEEMWMIGCHLQEKFFILSATR